jgi:hypothetical protein
MKKAIFTTVALILVTAAALVTHRVTNRYVPLEEMQYLPKAVTVDMGAVYVEKNLYRIKGGFWHKTREFLGIDTGKSDEHMEKLRTLPYVGGSKPPASRRGVTVYDETRAYKGYNLYTSAHSPQAFLMQMNGGKIHNWKLNRDHVWRQLADRDRKAPRRYFRRAHLYENGDLLVIYEYTGIVKLNWRSKVRWSYLGFNHHDMFVDDLGLIYTLCRDFDLDGSHAPVLGAGPPPRRYVDGRWVYDENITILDPGGKFLDRVSLIDCLENSEYSFLLRRVAEFREDEPVDLLHANTVEVFDGRHESLSPLYKKGNVLTSFRNLSTIAIIDMEKRTAVWAMHDAFLFQHDPRLLDNGRMMIFDNYSGGRTPADSFFVSSVIEFDPFTRERFWSYTGNTKKLFFSSLMGTSQPLPNGNVLVTESDYGRVFEITRKGDIVWQFDNPHLYGEQSEFVATVPEMQRLSPDFPVQNFSESMRRRRPANR